MKILIGLDEKASKAWMKRLDGKLPEKPDEVDFGVLQAAIVDPHARGRDIKANLILNYRGPFTMQLVDDSVTADNLTPMSLVDQAVEKIASILHLGKPKSLAGGKKTTTKGKKNKSKSLAEAKKKLKKPAKLKKGSKLKGKKQKALPPARVEVDTVEDSRLID